MKHHDDEAWKLETNFKLISGALITALKKLERFEILLVPKGLLNVLKFSGTRINYCRGILNGVSMDSREL